MATNLLRFKLTSLIGIRSYSTLNNGANTLIASRLNRTLTSLNGFGFQSVLKYSTFHQAAVNELVIADTGEWDVECDVAVVGSGGCGLVAAIAAAKGECEVILVEKESKPLSNTERSGGMIPAAGTRFQKEAGIHETWEVFVKDIMHKNHQTSDGAMTNHLAKTSKELVEWLVDEVGVSLKIVTDFKYPGHTQFRMHAPPTRTGAALVNDLKNAVNANEKINYITGSPTLGIIGKKDQNEVTGILTKQGDSTLRVKSRKVILACNGYGGNKKLLQQYCPEIADALYFGGAGNTGEGILWGLDMGGEAAFMDAYQGHANVAYPLGILITYSVIMEGGIHVNRNGMRFGDETLGYSERALEVLKQPEGIAWAIFDQKIHDLGMKFEEYAEAFSLGGIKKIDTLEQVPRAFGIDPDNFLETMGKYQEAAKNQGNDEFGRKDCRILNPPYYGVKIKGALFHTQGGLKVNFNGQVLRKADGLPIKNLYAGGGVAAGISGHGPGGYLSGNGLLTALGYGYLAGKHAASNLKK